MANGSQRGRQGSDGRRVGDGLGLVGASPRVAAAFGRVAAAAAAAAGLARFVVVFARVVAAGLACFVVVFARVVAAGLARFVVVFARFVAAGLARFAVVFARLATVLAVLARFVPAVFLAPLLLALEVARCRGPRPEAARLGGAVSSSSASDRKTQPDGDPEDTSSGTWNDGGWRF